jgi:hypothetical protein
VLGASRVDTRAPMSAYGGALLAGAHRTGMPYLTHSAATTELLAIDTSSSSDAGDVPVGLEDGTFLTTTGSLRFARNAQTPDPDQLLQAAQGSTTNDVITLPGSSGATLIGTELGLLWYTPPAADAGDAAAAGPLDVSFCSDAALAAKACTPEHVSLDLDDIVRVKDEAPYLYVWGHEGGSNVVVRFSP